MRELLFLFFLSSALSAGAQVITYDTIKVSPNDERNIHLGRPRKGEAEKRPLRRKRVYTAEEQAIAFDKSKLRFGANLGLSISRNYTNLGFGPQIGHQFNNYFMVGVGIRYYYTRVRTYEYETRNNLLGANGFGYLYPVSFITLFAQPEINYIWSDITSRTDQTKKKSSGFVPSFVVGGGFRLGRSHVTLNYDLAQRANSPHPRGFYLGISAFF